MPAQYPSNSYNKVKPAQQEAPTKDPKAAAKPIVKNKVTSRKKTFGEKFSDTFLAADFGSVVEHIFMDVLIPAAKDTIFNIIEGSTGMMLFGDRSVRGPRGGSRRSESRMYTTSYDKYYDDRDRKQERKEVSRPQSKRIVEDLLFDDRYDAEQVLIDLQEHIREYGAVSVKHMLDISNMPSDNYTLQNYGWFNLQEGTVLRIREGYLLKLPRPVVLD